MEALVPQNSLSDWQRRTCRLVFMVSCDPAPPPQCSWFSGREREQVEGVREGGEIESVCSRHSSDDGDGGSGGGRDLSCQTGEQRRHPGGLLNQLRAIRH